MGDVVLGIGCRVVIGRRGSEFISRSAKRERPACAAVRAVAF